MGFRLKLGSLFVDIGADTGGLKKAEKEIKRTTGSMEKSFSRLGGVIAAAISFEAIRRVVMLADTMNMLDARIKNVSRSAREFKIVRQGIRDIARETGNSIQSIGTLTQSLLLSADSIGATSEQIIEMTGNLSRLGTIGGSSGEQMSNAMLQFGQAMVGGVVRAEEFNSIVENTPLIAKSIADGLEIGVGELRKMVIEGKLLSKDVFDALLKQTAKVNDDFAKMPLTIDRASGMIAGSFAIAVQELDAGVEVTETIAEFMKGISDTITDDLVPGIDSIIDGFNTFLLLLDDTTAQSQKTTDEIFDWGESMKLVRGWVSDIVGFFINLPVHVKNLTTITVGEFDKLITRMKASATNTLIEIGNIFKNVMTIAIAAIQTAFIDFISTIRNKMGDLFEFFGADKLAATAREMAEVSKEISAEITAAAQAEVLARNAIADEEIAKIDERTAALLLGMDAAINMGILETEELKRQVAARIELIKKEREARRRLADGSKDASDELKTIGIKDTDDKKKRGKSNEQIAIESAGAIFGIEKEAAIASAALGLQSAIASVLSQGLSGFAALAPILSAFANVISSVGAVQAPGRQFGGPVFPGMATPINEGGTPEMFVNAAGRQFLLPNESGNVVPLQSGSGGGGPNIIINNNSTAEVTARVMSDTEIMIQIEDARRGAVDEVSTSLASGRGEVFESLRQGSQMTRNIA